MKNLTISAESLATLHEQLPALCFDPAADTSTVELPAAQDYLRFYHLHPEDFAHQLQHYLGMIPVAVSSGEKYNIACHYWLHPDAKDTVFVVHGYFDHVGLYGHLIQDLLERGSNVVAFDLPGHGISDGERATVASFDHYVEVFDTICECASSFLPKPWRAIGQSTGGAIVLKHLLEEELQKDKEPYTFRQIALLAPLVHPRYWGFNRMIYLVAHRFLKKIGRNFVSNSADQGFVEFVQHADPLQSRHLPLEWVGAMKRWTEELEALPSSDFPVTIIQGDKDTTLDWEDNLAILRDKLPKALVHILPGAQHQLVNEIEVLRNQVFDLVTQD